MMMRHEQQLIVQIKLLLLQVLQVGTYVEVVYVVEVEET